MGALFIFVLGVLFVHLLNVIDLGTSMLQAKVNLYITRKQVEINRLAEEEMKGQPLSYNIGFQCPDEEEWDEDDWEDDEDKLE